MKKLCLLFILFALPLSSHQSELDQFQWGMKSYLMILQKGMDRCNEKGYSYFKVEHCLLKSDNGKELSFKDVIRDESGERYEEITSSFSYIIYFYKEKPNDVSAVDVKKHNVLRKLATNHGESSSSTFVKDVQNEAEFLHEIQNSATPIYVKFYSPTCPPCSHLNPFFQNWAAAYAEKGKFLSIDINKIPSLRETYHVDALPTLLIFDSEGEVNDRYAGLGDIGQFIEEQLNK